MYCEKQVSAIFRFLLWCGVCLSMTGCQLLQQKPVVVEELVATGQPVDYFLSPYFFQLRPSRVVMLIPKMRNNSFEVQTKFADAVHRQLTEKGIFEVVVKAGFCDVDMDAIRSGTFDERQLLDIARRYTADGILFCEVTNFSAYEPLQLGSALTFVDMRESIVTLHTNGFWNTDDANVARKFLQDVCRIHRCKKYAAGVYLKSPSEFMSFVARDLTQFVQDTVYQGLQGANSRDAYSFSNYP